MRREREGRIETDNIWSSNIHIIEMKEETSKVRDPYIGPL